MFEDFIALVYPRSCLCCGEIMQQHEEHICNYCYLSLPRSHFHLQEDNPVEKLFYGRVPVFAAASYYLFNKQSGVQKLLHDIKYKGNRKLALAIGQWYGTELKGSERFGDIDCIIPVPLHAKKLRQRGYNQSELFAKGLAEAMNNEMNTADLGRRQFTTTQTKKSKFERWENVEDTFELAEGHQLSGKHVLLVDDVITTGATIEACALALQEAKGIRISLASIAFAVK